MKERLLAMRPLLLRVVGYPLFFTFWFIVFIYVTFPYDRLREAIVAAAEAPRRTPSGSSVPSNTVLSIGDIGPTFWPGVRAHNVVLTVTSPEANAHPVTTRMDTVTVHVGLFALIASNLIADINVEGLGGTIEMHLEQALAGTRPGLRELRMTLDRIRAGELSPLVAMVGLPLSGALNGTVELHVPDGHVEQSSGAIRLTVDDLRIGDGHAQYQVPHFGGITVEQIRAGRLEASITVREGAATIDRVMARSPEFQLAMDGRIELRPVLAQSEMNAGVRFQLTDAYRHKSEQAGRIMSVMDIIPDLQTARRPDGMLAFRCRGTFDRGLTCPPDPRGGGAGGGMRGAPSRRGFEP